ncbi:MAG: hypothetical protein KDA63_04255 [Planctomycetales bacterium]|nr:hypothetical protein [Planctomycetales bacterium]
MTIPIEPRFIDALASMPEALRVSATRDFTDSSLREVLDWLTDELGLVVLLDKTALADAAISPAEPISDRLDNQPVYLLLNRLRTLGLGWYFEDNVLHVTSAAAAESHETTAPYNVGDLLDAGFEIDRLVDVIIQTIAPTEWDMVGGDGAIIPLGDVLLVRQRDELQREIEGLLAALRHHGRQTFVDQPAQDLPLRAALTESLSVEFQDTPLEAAVAQLADATKLDIRLDVPALREARVREREPVTLKLADRNLETILQAMLHDLGLTWSIRDGVMWVTSEEQAKSYMKVAVYDVRDLCRDDGESVSLINAVESQLQPTSWDIVGGDGSIISATPGTLVVCQGERVQIDLLDLLETYRAALRASKPRQRDSEDPDEVMTVYYRMYTDMASDLAAALPMLVRSDSWQSESRPDAPGRVVIVASAPDLSDLEAQDVSASPQTPAPALTLVTARSVLIVTQTRAAHDEIAELIRRVESGDSPAADMTGGLRGGGLGGGGGFGGGFFQVPAEESASR